jgi:hypothetical protein
MDWQALIADMQDMAGQARGRRSCRSISIAGAASRISASTRWFEVPDDPFLEVMFGSDAGNLYNRTAPVLDGRSSTVSATAGLRWPPRIASRMASSSDGPYR